MRDILSDFANRAGLFEDSSGRMVFFPWTMARGYVVPDREAEESLRTGWRTLFFSMVLAGALCLSLRTLYPILLPLVVFGGYAVWVRDLCREWEVFEDKTELRSIRETHRERARKQIRNLHGGWLVAWTVTALVLFLAGAGLVQSEEASVIKALLAVVMGVGLLVLVGYVAYLRRGPGDRPSR